MNDAIKNAVSKVPELTLIFWVIKILATTLGETGGDAVSMSMNLGYLVGTVIFAVIFLCCSRRPNQGEAVSFILVLGHYYCNDNGGNDVG